jgi:thiamine pyrophosphate-dependent acetolactate synthase large subunit-like protein
MKMRREKAVEIIDAAVGKNALCIFSNGQIGREAYVFKDRKRNFYMLSSMGKTTSIGLGLALAKPERRVVVVEGDGNALMGLDAFALVGYAKPKNLIHLVLDNKEHATTGGQESHTTRVDLREIARGAGYATVQSADTLNDLQAVIEKLDMTGGPHFILAMVEKGNADVSRKARHAPTLIRDRFMKAAR